MRSIFQTSLALLLVGLSVSCSTLKSYDNALDYALHAKDKRLQQVFEAPDKYQVQLLFAQIDRSKEEIQIEEHHYRLEDKNYFYPASTVKFPIAVLSLEKLNEMGVDYKTPYQLVNDTLATSFKRSVEEIFAVSDNRAFNRLYEFLGKEHINRAIHQKGIDQFRIAHRLSTPNSSRLERSSIILNPVQGEERILSFKNDPPSLPLELNNLTKGVGYQHQGATIYEAFDFSLKNYYPIESQYQVLKRVIFPQLFEEEQVFSLSEEQRNFLLKSMSSLPRELGYDPKEFYDSYGKFFLFGDSKKRIPKEFKIYNKVGYAYGTLTDCAYITNTKTGVEFMLIATILVNENQIFNDNQYQYDSIGIPFLSALGKAIYRYEKRRKHWN